MKFRLLLLITVTIAFVFGCNESGHQNKRPLGGASPKSFIAGLTGEAIQVVRQGLADKYPEIRANAIEVISSSNRRDLMPLVIPLLKDEFAEVRFAAALAIGDMRFAPAKNKVKLLSEDDDKNVIMATAYALNRLNYNNYSPLIREAIRNKDQTIRANEAK